MDFFLAVSGNNLDPDSGVIGFGRNFEPRRSTFDGVTFLTKL